MNNQIQLLKWMLEDVRKETLEGVNHLTKEQLFQSPIEGEYPIGSYLMHFAECDIHWLEELSGVKQSDEIKAKSYFDKWFDSSEGSNAPKEPIEVEEYLDVIGETRKNFLDYVSSLSDSDLEKSITRKGRKGEFQLSKKWMIYHIIEHEAHHRGQMFLLIRKSGWNKK